MYFCTYESFIEFIWNEYWTQTIIKVIISKYKKKEKKIYLIIEINKFLRIDRLIF